MHSSCTAGCDHNCFGSCHHIITGLHILENGSCNLTFLIFQKFYRRGELNHRNSQVQNFIPDGTHDLRSRIILCCVHSLSGSSATVGGNHGSICLFIKLNTQFIEPFDRVRGFHNQSLYQLWFCSEMSAAEAIQIVLYRRIILLICCLDSSLCHHCIGITDSKLGYDHNVCSGVVRLNGTGRTCSTATDHKHIHIIINFCKVDLLMEQTAGGMQHLCQLQRCLLSFVRSHLDLGKCIWIIIRMELFQKSILFICGQTSGLCCHTLCSCSFYLFDRLHHIFWIWCIHFSCPPYFSISLLL